MSMLVRQPCAIGCSSRTELAVTNITASGLNYSWPPKPESRTPGASPRAPVSNCKRLLTAGGDSGTLAGKGSLASRALPDRATPRRAKQGVSHLFPPFRNVIATNLS